jgi:hypothetical protein
MRGRVLLAFGVTVFAIALAAKPVAARSMAIAGFDARVGVAADGAIDVTETITVDFQGAWQGLYRTIPVDYETGSGTRYSLILSVTAITDGAGHPLRYEGSRDGRYRKLKIFLPEAADARKVVVIGYHVPNALRFFADHDELYWNVTGNDWDVPIGDASARIDRPDGTKGLRADVYTGPAGSTAHEASVAVGARAVDVRTKRPLGLHEGLTVAIAWDKGAVQAPASSTRAAWSARANWPLALPLVAALLLGCLWLARGRDPRRRPIRELDAPPAGLSPAEAGTLVAERAGAIQVAATIVDLAARGFLTIYGAGGAKRNYALELKRQRSEWSGLKPHERLILERIFFADATTVRLSELENAFYQHLPAIRTALFDALLKRDYYRRRPDRTRSLYLIAATLSLLVPAFVLIPIAEQQWGTTPLTTLLGAFLTALVIGFIGWHMPARTEAGARAFEEVLGFKAFLDGIAARPAPAAGRKNLFETYLPFAIALKVDERWAQVFAGLDAGAPSWYVGYDQGVYDPVYFTQRMNVMCTDMSTTLSSSPRSNSDSSGGGGSSGGGDGGGGGGGF